MRADAEDKPCAPRPPVQLCLINGKRCDVSGCGDVDVQLM